MKTMNEYAHAAGSLFGAAPKAVWAAIAVSALTCGGDHIAHARRRALKEWWALHNAGIVPQRPPEPEPHDEEEVA